MTTISKSIKCDLDSFMDKNTLSLKVHIKTALFCNIYEIFKRDISVNPISIKAKIVSVIESVFISLQLISFL